MKLYIDFIVSEIKNQNYEISLHADDERINEGLTLAEAEYALLNSEILENYPDDPRGESCLTIGFSTEDKPIHIVCGINPEGHLLLITVYVPTMPKWKDPWTRNILV